MMTVRWFKKWNVINVIYIQNDACSVPKRGYKWLYFKYLLTRQQMIFHLFFSLTVSIRSWVLFPTLCGSINTKSMPESDLQQWTDDDEINYRVPTSLDLCCIYYVHTYILLTLDPRRDSRGVSDFPPRRPPTFYQNDLATIKYCRREKW
jgi:hypothetical protein